MLDRQTMLNALAFIAFGVLGLTLLLSAYSHISDVQSSANRLVQASAQNTDPAAISDIYKSLSEAISQLFTIVFVGSIFGGVLAWYLAQKIEFAKLLASHKADGICITDKHLKIQRVNQEFCRLSNRQESELYGKKLYDCFPGQFDSGTSAASTSQAFTSEHTNEHEIHTEISFRFCFLTLSFTKFGLLTLRDITRHKTQQPTPETDIDLMTGLPNRIGLEKHEEYLINETGTAPKPFALFFINLDGFKVINDSLGYQAGDEFLRQMAKRLASQGRETDYLARMAGDEFCIIYEDYKDVDELNSYSERLLLQISKPLDLKGRSITPQASAGFALYPEHSENKEELLHFAASAMYRAKQTGRHRVMAFDPTIAAPAHGRLDLEQDLRIALREQQFILFYQPQVSLQTGMMTGVEALIRWQHPEKGMIFPDEFIDVIESLGKMEELGDWVILEACKQQRRWADNGIHIDVAVNISGSHFQSGQLVASTLNALAIAGIEPERLELEITENVMQVADATIENFLALRDIGVKVAIDDFGTGYSSLGSLRTLPVDHLKVDRMFLHDVLVDKKQAVIISTIIGMAQALGLKVIVEGVETMEHILLLQGLGCTVVQGYYFSKPIPADKIPELYQVGFLPKPTQPQNAKRKSG